VARQSRTRQLIETDLGQHVALSVAAHLARTHLLPDPASPRDAALLLEILNRVGGALARVAPIYACDAGGTTPRELTAAELEGALVERGASELVLRDGRRLPRVTMKRADLRQAIAILKRVGVHSIAAPPPPAPAPRAPTAAARLGALADGVATLEALLRPPLVAAEMEKANRLAVSIARNAPQGGIANCAMQLMSALHEASSGEPPACNLELALARLRLALEGSSPITPRR
jgi:hypothetical protein